MTSRSKVVAIAGITGRMGNLIATHLIENTDFVVHGLCRSPENVNKFLTDHPARFKVFVTDVLKVEDIRKGIAGSSTVICTYNRMENQLMVDASKALIQACDAEGVDRFIASDYTVDYRALNIGDVFPKDPQIEIWRYLRDGNANGSIKVKGVHILVGIFVEAFYRFIFKGDKPEYWGTGNEPWEFVNYQTAAIYVAKVTADPACPTGFLKFCDYKATIKEIAAAVGKIKRDGSPLPIVQLGTLEEAKVKVDSLRGGNVNLFEHGVLIMMYYSQTPAYQLGDQLDNYRYPDVKKSTLEEAIRTFVN